MKVNSSPAKSRKHGHSRIHNVLKCLAILTLLSQSFISTGQLLTSEELKTGRYQQIDMTLLTLDSTMEGMEGLMVDEPDLFPMYPDGLEGVLRDFSVNVVYPMKARRRGYEGMFAIQYVIEKDGKISQIVPIETHGPINEILKDAAIQAVFKMKRWHPAFKDGEPVRVQFTQPVNFQLRN